MATVALVVVALVRVLAPARVRGLQSVDGRQRIECDLGPQGCMSVEARLAIAAAADRQHQRDRCRVRRRTCMMHDGTDGNGKVHQVDTGLAYRANAPVNWCPGCQTVLAHEQVLADGTCERSGDTVQTWTVDSGGRDKHLNALSPGGNPQTGRDNLTAIVVDAADLAQDAAQAATAPRTEEEETDTLPRLVPGSIGEPA